MPRVIHFDLGVDEPERAIKFYSKVFGWQIEKWDGPFDYWLIKTGLPGEPGIDGGFGQREDPSVATTNFIGVSSVDKYLKEIEANGGAVIQAKQAIPGVGYMATCQDTEGNTFGIMESDMSVQ